MSFSLFDGTVYLPKPLIRRLRLLAEELQYLERVDVDEHELARAILTEFVKNYFESTTKDAARIITGMQRAERQPQDDWRRESRGEFVRFFRVSSDSADSTVD